MKYNVCLILIISFFSCSKERNVYTRFQNVFVSDSPVSDEDFVGHNTCKKCHLQTFEHWRDSHHERAMQKANRVTVLADFRGETFKSQSVISRFFQKGNDFYVNTEGVDGKYHDYKIIYTFGVEPLQQYIVKFPKGRYQVLRTAWDTHKKKWFDLYPNFKIVHYEWLHWTNGGLNWNNMCSDCHSTNVRENYNAKNQSYNTQYSLLSVSCEACHGPGNKHIEKVQTMGANYKASDDILMRKNSNPKSLVDACGRCHMRRTQISKNYNFQGTLLDHYEPQLITPNIYHVDGQILEEVYVYGSFLQSKMYHNNVTCIDCHNPHSLKLKYSGNGLCIQCHVKNTYDTSNHHKHPMGTDSAKCINCHMFGKYYMGVDFRRDHSFRVPRPDVSLRYNTPNACTQCHQKIDDSQNDKWVWEGFKRLYGYPKDKHFSEELAPALKGNKDALQRLKKLAKDTLTPEIVRASAILAMQNHLHQQNISNDLLTYLKDNDPVVKSAALEVLNNLRLPPRQCISIFELLKHSKRLVRIKAFYAISHLGEHAIPNRYQKWYQKVKLEFFSYIEVNADFVGGLVKKAGYLMKKNKFQKAITSYEDAQKIDPTNNILLNDLANLYYQNRQFEKAAECFQQIVKTQPNYAPAYQSLALLLGELKQFKKAIFYMEKAIALHPNDRMYYNLSLLYHKDKNTKKAIQILKKALKRYPKNKDLLNVLEYLQAKGI